MAYDTPAAAEQAFYVAFAHGDLNTMMSVWADVPYIVCVHPLGAQLTGPEEVREGWRQIFDDNLPREFELEHQSAIENASIAVRMVHEIIRIPGFGHSEQPLIATNVYQFIDDSWQMIVHHASPGEAKDMAEQIGESAPVIH